MSVHQRRPIHSEAQSEEEPQQGEHATTSNKSFAILHWLKNEIYDYVTPSYQYAVQFLRYGIKSIIQALVFVTLLLGVIYVVWKYVVKMLVFLLICESIVGYLPGISTYCTQHSKTDGGNSTMALLPVDSFVEKTVALAERLSDTDVSAPIKLTEVKISLIDLKTNVMYSQIDQITKDQLVKQIDNMKSSVSLTTNEIHKMLASFNGALSKMEIYTNTLFRVLTDKTEAKINQNNIQPQFEKYLQNIESEIERIIHIAENVYSMLANLEAKTDVLNDIASKSHQTNDEKLKQIEHGSFIAKLYQMTIGNGNINKVKYQRNLMVLDRFSTFTKSAATNIENVIVRLNTFKSAIEEMKSSISEMDRGQTLPVDIHIEILKDGLVRLHKYKQRLDGRITESTRDQV